MSERSGVSRRDLFVGAAAGLGVVAGGQSAADAQAPAQTAATAPEELVFVNGRIHDVSFGMRSLFDAVEAALHPQR